MKKVSMFDIPKMVLEDWIELPKEVDFTIFLDGRKFLDPESIPMLRKVITEYDLNQNRI